MTARIQAIKPSPTCTVNVEKVDRLSLDLERVAAQLRMLECLACNDDIDALDKSTLTVTLIDLSTRLDEVRQQVATLGHGA